MDTKDSEYSGKTADFHQVESSSGAAAALGLVKRLEALKSWVTGLNAEAPAIRNQAAILINDAIARLGAPAAQAGSRMWAVLVEGPDDIHAAPDREVADAVALVLNRQFNSHPLLRQDDRPRAVVIEWPHGYESWSAEKDLLRLEVIDSKP